jgi:hypothetical protein
MKYLKSFNESVDTNSWLDEYFSSPEEIAKLIDSYFRDHDYSNLMQNMDDLLIQTHPNNDYVYRDTDELMRYDEILLVVNTLIEHSKEPWWSVKFERFLGFLAEIQEESQQEVSIEEIEDLFLDLDYKCSITKAGVHVRRYGKPDTKVPGFNIQIFNTAETDAPLINNKIWNSISKRLPREFQIHKVDVERDKDQFDFTIIISKKAL